MLSPSNDPMIKRVEQIALQRVQVNARHDIGDLFAEGLSLEIKTDIVSNQLYALLRGYVFGEKVRESIKTVSWSVPATWWDHFKEDAMPKWLRRFFKPPAWRVKSTTVRFEQIECYPRLDRALDPREKNPRITFTQEKL